MVRSNQILNTATLIRYVAQKLTLAHEPRLITLGLRCGLRAAAEKTVGAK